MQVAVEGHAVDKLIGLSAEISVRLYHILIQVFL